MTQADSEIIALAAKYHGVEADINATPGDADSDGTDTLTDIEERLAALVPTTPEAAIEVIDILSEHDEAGLRALSVLRGLLLPATA